MTELTKPGDCNNMDELRHQIDKLDVKIIELLANRSEFIDLSLTHLTLPTKRIV